MDKRVISVLVATAALAGASLMVLTAGPAAATTVTDEASLRAAFGNAAETQIDLDADITLSSVCPNGEVTRTSSTTVVVDGHGHTVTQTCASGNNSVFVNAAGGDLQFRNITITGGSSAANGGGIATAGGDVSLTNSSVTGNSGGAGGGIAANSGGTVGLTNSTVSNNSASAGGGGILASAVGMTNSTVSGNTAGANLGGGIEVPGSGLVSLTNSTVSGNTAGTEGGGVVAFDVTLVYSTVAGNSAPQGANLDIRSLDTLTAFGSVVALPAGGGGNCFFEQGQSTTSNGSNWDDDASCGFGAGPGDHSNGGDPLLGALANNGGSTQTQLPQPGSPLIDAIPVASCQADGASGITADQRGVTRPQGSGCDIGAVEVAPVTPPVVTPAPATPLPITPAFTG
jgi:hypothetical protein